MNDQENPKPWLNLDRLGAETVRDVTAATVSILLLSCGPKGAGRSEAETVVEVLDALKLALGDLPAAGYQASVSHVNQVVAGLFRVERL